MTSGVTQIVRDDGSLRRYRTEIPNIIFGIGLTAMEIALYCVLKRTAGDNGKCWKGTAALAKEAGMSAGMVSKIKTSLSRPRKELRGKSLIQITEEARQHGGRDAHIIVITDIWPENMAVFSKEASSCGELASSYSEQASSCGEIKKNPLKKEPREEAAPRASANDHQHTQPSTTTSRKTSHHARKLHDDETIQTNHDEEYIRKLQSAYPGVNVPEETAKAKVKWDASHDGPMPRKYLANWIGNLTPPGNGKAGGLSI